jgi:hypothetical protein
MIYDLDNSTELYKASHFFTYNRFLNQRSSLACAIIDSAPGKRGLISQLNGAGRLDIDAARERNDRRSKKNTYTANCGSPVSKVLGITGFPDSSRTGVIFDDQSIVAMKM